MVLNVAMRQIHLESSFFFFLKPHPSCLKGLGICPFKISLGDSKARLDSETRALEQCFSNFNVHMDHVKMKISVQQFWVWPERLPF